MAVNRVESPKPAIEQVKTESGTPSSANGAGQVIANKAGFKAWLPLLITAAVMPLLAYATATFVLVPKMKKALVANSSPENVVETPSQGEKHGSAAAEGKEKGPGNGKILASLSKNIMVNVNGSMGTRYLVAGLTLVGTRPDFKEKITKNDDQLRDLVAGILTTKTIHDLEKPGARNLIRSELILVLNNVLGAGVIQEIYITDFAIQ
jgi:flagellar FliL protein